MAQEAAKYQSVQGETLDSICYHYYGRTKGILEKVLDANPTLAEHGPILPVGTWVNLPPLNEPVAINKDVLWV